MAQGTRDGTKPMSFTNGAAARVRGEIVKLDAGLIVICDADDDGAGVVRFVVIEGADASEVISVKSLKNGGSVLALAGEAMSDNAVVYIGAAGTLVDTDPGSATAVGIVVGGAAAVGEFVEFLPY